MRRAMTKLQVPRVALLGCGSMGEAIAAGALRAGADPAFFTATVRGQERALELASRLGIRVWSIQEDKEANLRAAADADVVVLGVKPVGIAELARSISPALRPDAVVVSVAAAVTLEQLEAALPEGQGAVRAIPNIPLAAGSGLTGLTAGRDCRRDQFVAVRGLFAAGRTVEVAEAQQNAVMAIGGSGPAYVYYFTEALAAAGISQGLDEETARAVARQTVMGAAQMLAETESAPEELRAAVTSPHGTTEQAIAVFEAGGLKALTVEAAGAAVARAVAMTTQLDGRAQ
jgi:pyrroline-5-carboxylate reductase